MMYLLRGLCAFETTKSPVYAVADIAKYNTMAFNLTFTRVILAVTFVAFQFTGLGNRTEGDWRR